MVVVEGQRCEIAWQEIVKFESSILIVMFEVISINFYEQAGARGAKERAPFGAAFPAPALRCFSACGGRTTNWLALNIKKYKILVFVKTKNEILEIGGRGSGVDTLWHVWARYRTRIWVDTL